MQKHLSKALAMAVMMSVLASGSAYAADVRIVGSIEYQTGSPGQIVIEDDAGNQTTIRPGGVYLNNGTVTGLADGDISSASSTDAVNGGQLYTALKGKVDAGTAAGDGVAIGSTSKANGVSVAIGKAAYADGPAALAIGVGAEAINPLDVAIGAGATAEGNGSVALGDGAHAEGYDSYALGVYAHAEGYDSYALGVYAHVSKDSRFAYAIGTNTEATANYANAFGFEAKANGSGSVAIGTNAKALETGAYAIGNGATANGENSVAIGNGSVADEANTISVGKSGAERKIVNVAKGENDTDAVNKEQMEQGDADTLQAAKDYTDQEIKKVAGGASSEALEKLDSKINQTNDRVDRVGATAAALAGIHYQPMAKGQSQVAVGMGGYKGKKATALGLAYQFNDRVSGSVAGAANGSEHMFNVGFNYLFGQHSEKDVAQCAAVPGSMSLKEAEMQATIDSQNAKINSMEARMAQLEAMVKALAAK